MKDIIYCSKWLNTSVCFIDETMAGSTASDESGPGSNGNEEVLSIS